MPIETCHQIILLHRLRDRARKLIEANSKAGNWTVADMYARIDNWLEVQMSFAMSGGR